MAGTGKGKIKEAAGKLTGDAKLEAEGKGDQLKGKAKNAIGGLKMRCVASKVVSL